MGATLTLVLKALWGLGLHGFDHNSVNLQYPSESSMKFHSNNMTHDIHFSDANVVVVVADESFFSLNELPWNSFHQPNPK